MCLGSRVRTSSGLTVARTLSARPGILPPGFHGWRSESDASRLQPGDFEAAFMPLVDTVRRPGTRSGRPPLPGVIMTRLCRKRIDDGLLGSSGSSPMVTVSGTVQS